MKDDDLDASSTERAFYAAFAGCDLEAMRRVWAEDVRTVCVHPGGAPLRGTEAILRSWTEILSGVAPPEIRHRQVQSLASGALAVHTVEELIRPKHSEQAPTKVIATNVYELTAEGWRMLVHHASLPLVSQGKGARRPLH